MASKAETLGEAMAAVTRGEVDQRLERTRKVTAGTRHGKTMEQLAPFLDEFEFNPRDARFIGDPIDFLVFHGLDDGDMRELVIVEVKSGRPTLNQRQRQVKKAVEEGRVRWEVVHLGAQARRRFQIIQLPEGSEEISS